MAVVRLYASFRRLGGERAMEVATSKGGTVRDLLNLVQELRPALAGRILDGTGKVPRFVAVFVNGRDIRHLDGLDTSVGPADEVDIFPPVAGGWEEPYPPPGKSKEVSHDRPPLSQPQG